MALSLQHTAQPSALNIVSMQPHSTADEWQTRVEQGARLRLVLKSRVLAALQTADQDG